MNYPKMLYKGNTKDFQHIIANDAQHEDQLKESGYDDFDQLKEPEIDDHASESIGESKNNTMVDIEQFNAVSEKLADTEKLLTESQAEVERLNAVIERGSAENAELRNRISELTVPTDSTEVAAKPKTTRTKAES